jgi:50S ribosomal subunit-associated GTPase HflX
MDALIDRVERALRPGVARVTLRIPYRDGPAIAQCYERGRVLSRSDDVDGILLEVELPPRLLGPLEPYRQAG